MRMAFPQTGSGYTNKLCVIHQFLDIISAAVTHPRTKTAYQLVDDICKRTFIWNPSLNTFRNQFALIFLEITVFTAFFHGTKRAHASVYLKSSTLEYFCITRTFFRSSE